MADKKLKREQALKLWSFSGKSDEEIATILNISAKEVHNLIYGEPVSLSAISNEEDLVQTMCAQGKTEDEIAGILDIDVRLVRAFLEGERDD